MYLVIKCIELSDQWECDAYRCPMFITEDRNEAFKKKDRDYLFEVWQTTGVDGKILKRIKEYDE